MSLEAARTRARIQAAHAAQLLPGIGGPTLLGYALHVIRSPAIIAMTARETGSAGFEPGHAAANQPAAADRVEHRRPEK